MKGHEMGEIAASLCIRHKFSTVPICHMIILFGFEVFQFIARHESEPVRKMVLPIQLGDVKVIGIPYRFVVLSFFFHFQRGIMVHLVFRLRGIGIVHAPLVILTVTVSIFESGFPHILFG